MAVGRERGARGNKVVGGNRRRALRGPGAPAGGRGRTETPPATLSACATCNARGHYARAVRTRIAHAKFARASRTTTGHAHYPGGAMGTSRPTAITPVWCAAITHPQNSHAHYPGALRTATGHAHRPWGFPTLPARALSPLPTRGACGETSEKKEPARSASSFCRGTARIVRRFRPFRRQPR